MYNIKIIIVKHLEKCKLERILYDHSYGYMDLKVECRLNFRRAVYCCEKSLPH